jgi:short-subunit dehydrogenase
MPQAIIIGASSGIGEALARRLAKQGWRLGLAARRLALLEKLCRELGEDHTALELDVSKSEEAISAMAGFLDGPGGVDLIILCAGTGHLNEEAAWEPDQETIAVNVMGFAAMAQLALRHFLQRGSGHLVGVTSVAALRSSGAGAAYSASKAFGSMYLDGLRALAKSGKLPITVTEVIPGFVDTAMMQADKPFWVASPDKAAAQILSAIERKANRVYITRRWAIIGTLLKLLPR